MDDLGVSCELQTGNCEFYLRDPMLFGLCDDLVVAVRKVQKFSLK